MTLEFRPQRLELLVQLGHLLGHVLHWFGGANTSNDILALGVYQILSEELIFPGARVSRERHPSTAVVAHIAEDHCYYVNRRAISHIFGDIELASIVHRPLAHP